MLVTLAVVCDLGVAFAGGIPSICTTGQDVTFQPTGAIESMRVPANVTEVTILATGAEGGSRGDQSGTPVPGGHGAIIRGTFAVAPLDRLHILVGRKGDDRPSGNGGAGGGGGSFVAKGATLAASMALLVAGGGGGAGRGDGASGGAGGDTGLSIAPTGTAGGQGGGPGGTGGAGDFDSSPGDAGGVGGIGGNGGASSVQCGAGGGGGFSGDGGSSAVADGGKSFLNGGAGGASDTPAGGFGGGGEPTNCGGGGGGFNGGGAGGDGDFGNATTGGGGGGGSLNLGTSQSNSAGGNTGDGIVHVCFANVATPNDACEDAFAITSLPFEDARHVDAATHEAADPVSSCERGASPASVWYRFAAAADATIVASTLGSDYDTIVTVLAGSCGAATEVACQDDVGASGQSRVVFDAVAGQTYLILVTSAVSGANPDADIHIVVDALPARAAAKARIGCQATIKKSAAALVAKTLASQAKCADLVFKCVQLENDDPACIENACEKCGQALAKAGEQGTKLTANVAKKCPEARVPFARVLGATGLGFEALADACDETTGMPLDGVGPLGACIRDTHTCSATLTFNLAMPRLNELLLGRCSGLPIASECVNPDEPDGAVAADQAKAVTKCAAGIAKASTKLVLTKLKALEKCVDRVFACLATKPSDDPCAVNAEPKCAADVAKVAAARLKFLESIEKKCADVPFDVLRSADGLDIDAATDACESIGVTIDSLADYGECIFRRHSCRAEDMMSLEAPLASLLLDVADQPPLLATCN